MKSLLAAIAALLMATSAAHAEDEPGADELFHKLYQECEPGLGVY